MAYTAILNSSSILRDDGATIPADAGNRDYQDYLSWVAGGNSPIPAAVPAKPVTIPVWDFLNRFTAAEQGSVQAACNANLSLGVGLSQALARGAVTLNDTAVTNWMTGLVNVGAVTAARSSEITTP